MRYRPFVRGHGHTKARIERIGRPVEQIHRLRQDARALVGNRPTRWLRLPFTSQFAILASYRLNRAAFLAWGRGWSAARAVTAPLSPLVRIFVTSELDYRADLGGGVRILHPQLGVVIGGGVVAGPGLVLAGGNVIGEGNPELGDGVSLGVNASILGDVHVGDGVVVAAGAVVVRSFPGPGMLAGVPAVPRQRRPV